jgi:hypothetical protein
MNFIEQAKQVEEKVQELESLNGYDVDRQVKNSTNGDKLLDWLDLYGASSLGGASYTSPFNPPLSSLGGTSYTTASHTSNLPTLLSQLELKQGGQGAREAVAATPPDLEFGRYINEKKNIFFYKCIEYAMKKLGKINLPADIPSSAIQILTSSSRKYACVKKYEETLSAMKFGIPIIAKGLLLDEKSKMICLPDLLVRQDLLPHLFENREFCSTLPAIDERKDSEYKYSYVVIQVRWAKLQLSKKSWPELLSSSKNIKYYEALLNAQTRALRNCTSGQINANQAYILGRNWQCGQNRNDNCFDLLGVIKCDQDSSGYNRLIKSCNWLKLLKKEGSTWSIWPEPSNKYLRPNMKNDQDYPWTSVKKFIAEQTKEITLLWQVGLVARNVCLKKGITRYDDERLTTDILCMPRGKNSSRLTKIILANRGESCAPPLPPLLSASINTCSPILLENDDGNSGNSGNNEENNSGESSVNKEKLLADKNLTCLLKINPIEQDVGNNLSSSTLSYPSLLPSPLNYFPEFSLRNGKDSVLSSPMLSIGINSEFSSREGKGGLGHVKLALATPEFYVDFETKPSIDDNMSNFPFSTDTSMISMIGCGYEHPLKKVWVPIKWTVAHLTLKEESKLIDTWLRYMKDITDQYDHLWSKDKKLKKKNSGKRKIDDENISFADNEKNRKFKCFNWSKAEEHFLEKNYNSAVNRHGKEKEWKNQIYWADMHQFCKEEELAIKGCFNFSLKSVIKALHKLGKIDDVWISSPVENGMSAMMALIRCEEDAIKNNRSMEESLWMSELVPYLFVDIHSVYSFVKFLRKWGR